MRRMMNFLSRSLPWTVSLLLLPVAAGAVDRPRPGDPIRAHCVRVADPGTFDMAGEFAVRARRTRRGYEAVWIRVPAETGARHFLYSPPTDRVIELTTAPQGIDPVAPPRGSRLASFLPASCLSGHPRWEHWSRAEFPGSPLSKGAAYAAKNREDGLHLMVDAIAEESMRDYGPILDDDGETLGRAAALTAGDNGDLYLLTVTRRELVLAVIEDVFLDELMDLRTRSALAHFAEELPAATRVRSLSLSAIGAHLDRGFDCLAAASDGNVYFGTMPHHPTRGTLVLRYLPKAHRLERLGDLDRIGGIPAALDVPSMMHTTPVEIDGVVYVTGQDPFYGRANLFPELADEVRHPGSRILGYDLGTGAWRDLGIPFPGASIFWMGGVPGTGILYVKTGYGAGAVHALDIASHGLRPPEARPESRNVTTASSNSIAIGADGALYVSRGAALVRCDPGVGQEESLGALDAPVAWIKGQHGRDEIFGIAGNAVVRLDTAGRTFEPVGRFDRAPGLGDSAIHDGRVYKASLEGGRQGENRACRLLSFDIATGLTRDHGILVDDEDRIVQEVFAMDLGADGIIYMQGPVFPKAGDAYSPRLKRYFLNENRLLVLRR